MRLFRLRGWRPCPALFQVALRHSELDFIEKGHYLFPELLFGLCLFLFKFRLCLVKLLLYLFKVGFRLHDFCFNGLGFLFGFFLDTLYLIDLLLVALNNIFQLLDLVFKSPVPSSFLMASCASFDIFVQLPSACEASESSHV